MTGRIFTGVLVAGLLWRLLLALVVVPAWEARAGVAPAPDAYPVLASSLVQDHVLGYGKVGASPTTVRGPGFPGWLAIGLVLGGERPSWLGLWGGLPGLLAGAWLAAIAAHRFGTIGGVAAGAVAVLHPLPSLIASRVMGDDFYAAVGFGALALWAVALRDDDRGRIVACTLVAGLLLAVQILTRSSGVLTLLVAAGYALWTRRSKATWVLLLAAVAMLPPLAWSVRTSSLEGRPVFVHSLAAYNFWIGEGFERFGGGDPPSGNYPRIVGFALSQAGDEYVEPRFWYASLEPRQAAELDSRLADAAVEHVLNHPFSYAARVVRGVPAYWIRGFTTTRTVQYALVVAPVLLLAALGIRRAVTDPLGAQLLLVLLAHNLAYAAVLPAARMSVQVYPALAYLAGAGLAAVIERVRT